MDYYVGEIRLFAGNYAPEGWAFCDGSLLTILGHEALYSLIGTRFGGDGSKTFALPNLAGRLPVGVGTPIAPLTQSYPLGTAGGSATVTLAENQLPPHSHHMMASREAADTTAPAGAVPADPSDSFNMYIAYQETAKMVAFPDNALGTAGQSGAHNNIMPCLAIRYIIATNGLYPTGN